MKQKHWILQNIKTSIAILFLSYLCVSCCEEAKTNKDSQAANSDDQKPNIVFILVDDLGMISMPIYLKNNMGDTGYVYADSTSGKGKNLTHYITERSAYKTPKMDSFAREGVRFERMYATPLCATSRAQLMTGRYPFRNNMVFPAYSSCRPATNTTKGYLSEANLCYPYILREQGYKTAFGGKWNLRFGRPNNTLDQYPKGVVQANVQKQKRHLNENGFDLTFGSDSTALLGSMVDYYPPQLDSQYFPYALNEWVLNYIKKANDKEPFYLHYCLGLIHDSYSTGYGGRVPLPHGMNQQMSKSQNWATRMMIVDSLIGTVLDTLKAYNLDSNTIVIIAGDNGTESTYYSLYDNQVLRGGKSTLNSYGSRVPFMVRWPNNIRPNSVNKSMTDFADVFPTMIELSGGEGSFDKWKTKNNPKYVINGNSFLGSLTNRKPKPCSNQSNSASKRKFIFSQYNSNGFITNEEYQIQYISQFDSILVDVTKGPGQADTIQPVNGVYPNKKHAKAFKELNDAYVQLGAQLYIRTWCNVTCD